MLELKNVSKVYNNESGQVVTGLSDINLKFAKSGFVFITGSSGSGKTTLLNILGAIDTKTSGHLLVNGVYIENFTESALDAYRTNFASTIYQDLGLIEHLTLEENVSLAIEIQGREVCKQDITDLFNKLDISGLEKRYPHEVSGGQLQRVAIARVLIKKPKIILSDELTSSLDDKNRDEIYQILKDVSKDTLVVATTHNVEMIKRHADRIIKLENGNVVHDNNKASIIEKDEQKFSFEDSRMSSKQTVSLAWGNFRINKLRTIFSIVLSILAITFFAISLNLSTLTHNRAIISSFLQSDSPYIVLRDNTRIFSSADHDNWTRQSGFANTQSALLYQISPHITTTFNTPASHEHTLFNIRYLAIIEGNVDASSANKFGQTLIHGNWSSTKNDVVISDFMAYQIVTAYHAHGLVKEIEDLINYNLVFGEVEYNIAGIYQTDFNQYFIMGQNNSFARFWGNNQMTNAPGDHFIANTMMRLRTNLSDQAVSRALYLIQNDWVTAFTSVSTIQGIQSGSTGSLHIDSGALNEISIDPGSNFFLNDPIGSMTSLNQSINDHGLVIRRDPSILSERTMFISSHLENDADIMSSLPFVVMHSVFDQTPWFINLSTRIQPNVNSPIQHIPIARFDDPETVFGIEPLSTISTDSLTENIIVLSSSDFAKFVNMLIIPSTSMAVSRNYSLDRITAIIDNMGGNVEVMFSDSYSISNFMNSFDSVIIAMLPVSIVMAILAILIIVGYIGMGIRSRRKMIAILRSLGAKRNDTRKIFIAEAGIFTGFIVLGSALLIFLFMLFGNIIARSISGHALSIFAHSFLFYAIVLGATLFVIVASYIIFLRTYSNTKNGRVAHAMKIVCE
ncbi:MAG: ABC transporter ATP-binding protein/permease [Firmicutes bacterium]|nr:ABC transporter ATP-binding protein/permease [Bacillota bacterium]